MKATININLTQAFTSNNLKGKSFKVVETVGNRTTLNINGRMTDFYDNEITVLETREIKNVEFSFGTKIDEYFKIDCIVRADNKIKLLFDTCGDRNWSWQTVKETGKGFYIKCAFKRVYFAISPPKF